MVKTIHKELYLFFIRKIIQQFEESADLDQECICNLKEVLVKVGQSCESDNMKIDQGAFFLFYPLMTVKLEILIDTICDVSDFHKKLQVISNL